MVGGLNEGLLELREVARDGRSFTASENSRSRKRKRSRSPSATNNSTVHAKKPQGTDAFESFPKLRSNKNCNEASNGSSTTRRENGKRKGASCDLDKLPVISEKGKSGKVQQQNQRPNKITTRQTSDSGSDHGKHFLSPEVLVLPHVKPSGGGADSTASKPPRKYVWE